MIWHVEPVTDLKPHTLSGEFCKCKPRVEVQPNGKKVIVHNAWDGREFGEDVKDDGIAGLSICGVSGRMVRV